MFGYIVLSSKAEKEDKKIYREAYCGLCHMLREKYGKEGAIVLSYDMTFLSLLLGDLNGDDRKAGIERCAIHPVKSHTYFTLHSMDYTSDMQILLSYYSLIDSINDEKKGERHKKNLEPFIPELEKKYPRQTKAIKENLSLINENEKRNVKDMERMALYFGQLLGEIFVRDETSFFREELYLIGCNLGKFIYVLDGWDDRKKDEKKGLYNPLEKTDTYEKINEALTGYASGAAESYNKLPLDEYTSILDNILYSGMWTKFRKDKKENK